MFTEVHFFVYIDWNPVSWSAFISVQSPPPPSPPQVKFWHFQTYFEDMKFSYKLATLDMIHVLAWHYAWSLRICLWSVKHRGVEFDSEPGSATKTPGGFFHQNRTWMCLTDLENLTISIPIFCQISHPSVYHFRKKNTQFGSNWVLFTIICPKYTQFM